MRVVCVYLTAWPNEQAQQTSKGQQKQRQKKQRKKGKKKAPA
jgi:hypothetical protein